MYDEKEYRLAEVKSIDTEAMCTYLLPDQPDGRYNLVLHGLIGLAVGERAVCRVRFITDFDAQCVGLHTDEFMEIE